MTLTGSAWDQECVLTDDGIRIVMLDGFAGDDVTVEAEGQPVHRLEMVTTSLLTGKAAELTLPTSKACRTRIQVNNRGLDASVEARPGNTLMVSIIDGALIATEMSGRPGFL